ncbi:transglycosylase domain-containing protein [Marinactinospora rubrisoli]|uniref:Transglycosylase domain-containing protein n=1 Tax=Marinactinospora rubrisoli TaxID=2715399 RepID=A0ABW2KFA5_9ACTN
MSTERRRSAGGRRRADGPAGDPRGNGGRRGSGSRVEDERAAGRRRAREDDGFWDDDRERRPRRARDDHDDHRERPRRRAAAAAGAAAAAEGVRRRPRDDEDDLGPRRSRRAQEERGGRRRAGAHGARSEGARRAAGGRRRADHDDEEHDERGPVRRFFAKVWKPALIVCGVGFVAAVVAFGVAYAQMPDATEMEAQASVRTASSSIRYADEEEATTFGEVNRFLVTREQIPETVVNGVLGSEQRTFYEDPAISPVGLGRAVLSGGSAGGGSTITQQMARNYYDGLSQERSYLRKIKEILISLKVEQSLSKDQILTQYLNTIYFGRNAHGIQAAAQAYFGKNVEDLDAAEGAFIGAIIQQPSNFQNVQPGSEMEDVLRERWEYSVNGMVVMHEDNPERGISQEEADQLEFPEVLPYEPGDNYAGYNGYIIEAVKRELRVRYDLTDEQMAGNGYTISTSLEQKYMDAAVQAVQEEVPEGTPEETNFGLAAVVPQTGEIKGFYGGDNALTDTDNSLIQRGQAGSAFKPYVLATGLAQGIGLRSTFDGDSPQEFPGVGEPIQNDSNESHGTVDLIYSTARSVNTSFVELAIRVGPENVVETARAAGIPDAQFETAELGPNIALGTYQVTALDQAAGFATFANEGVHVPQHMVTEVRNSEGEVIEPNDADQLDGERAFDADVAADATYAMQQVVSEEGGASSAALPGRPVAGKTGTSNEARSAWFVGFTPQLSTAVGLHRSDGQQLVIPGVQDVYGSRTPAAIWKNFMLQVMEGEPVEQFPEPAWVGDPQNFAPTPSPDPTPSNTPDTTPSNTPDPTPSNTPDTTPSNEETPPCMPFGGENCEEETPESPSPPDDNGNGNEGDPPWFTGSNNADERLARNENE